MKSAHSARTANSREMNCFAAAPGLALAVRRGRRVVRQGLLADAAVDSLAEQVGVAEVAGIFLDHVEYHLT